jgi:alkylation response protein AidB-like acyl-CoA dehydrogenase
MTEQPAVDSGELAEVSRRIDALLAEFPPTSTAPTIFWGAQYDAGLAWVHFPVGLGGLGAPAALQEIVAERLRAAGAESNALRNFVGIGTVAPTLVNYGTDEHKAMLRPLFTCEQIWCQLFSEPEAGSDLAALRTSALRDGDVWRLSGHKVWTTLAHVSQFGFCIARTNPDAGKHHDLSCFIVDMAAPGVTVRAIRQITGEAEFNEVFLDEVLVEAGGLVGPIDQGWRVTMSTLMSERAHNGEIAKKPRGDGPIAHALRLWKEQSDPDPLLRDRLVRDWITAEAIRLTAMRAEQRRTPGMAGAEGSILKLVIGEFTQEVMDLCVDLTGLDGALIEDYEMRRPDTMAESTMGDGHGSIDVTKAFLNARSSTIGGGTTEMQRNAIGERLLGLPRDARPTPPRAGALAT